MEQKVEDERVNQQKQKRGGCHDIRKSNPSDTDRCCSAFTLLCDTGLQSKKKSRPTMNLNQ